MKIDIVQMFIRNSSHIWKFSNFVDGLIVDKVIARFIVNV